MDLTGVPRILATGWQHAGAARRRTAIKMIELFNTLAVP
jgi:hypothetical protein